MNAYYFPDGDYRDLYQTITPVNTFRIVLNKYFGRDFERLPDRIYAYTQNYYDFYEITDISRNPISLDRSRRRRSSWRIRPG